MANKRAQYFTFEVYPESAPKDWQDILKSYHIPMYLSEHAKDASVDKSTGEITPKKTHWHIMVLFDSLKGLDILDEVIEAVHGVKPPLQEFIVWNKRSYARYLTHMDDSDKYPYYLDPDHEVIAIGGAEPYNELVKGAEETRQAEMNTTKDIQDYCEKKGISNVAMFLRLCRATDHDEWIDAIKKNSYFWGMWFNALRHEDPMERDHSEASDIIKRALKEKEERGE